MMNDEEKKEYDLAERTKSFALRIVKMYAKLPKTALADVLGKQVLRSGTSVGAHYREGRRARSTAEFISKLEVAIQELDETIYWLDLIVASDIMTAALLTNLQNEAQELISIFVASIRTAKKSRQ